MANRDMVRKVRASRRRAYLQKPRQLHVPNMDVVKEYARRGRSNEDSISELDHIIRLLRKWKIPGIEGEVRRLEARTKQSGSGQNDINREPEKFTFQETLKKADQDAARELFQHGVFACWQNWKYQRMTEFNCVKCFEEGSRRIYWFWSGPSQFFCEENQDLMCIRLSMFYPDKARAFRDLERDRVFWIKTFSLSSNTA